jgi:hypothetical protein
MRVGFDLDGVLYNFGDSVKRYLDSIGKGDVWKSGPNPKPYWDFYKDWGWTGKEFVELCNDGADAGYIFCGPAREHAVEAVERVARLGHEIIIITDRQFGTTPEVSHGNTVDWLRANGIEYDELVFSADKTCVPTDTFIEDKLENYDALVANGTHAFLVNRAWNFVEHGDARNRIESVLDYASAIENMTAKGFADLAFA